MTVRAPERYSEIEINRLLDDAVLTPHGVGRVAGWCLYEGDKPEQGYEVLIWFPSGEFRRCGRRELGHLRGLGAGTRG